MPVKELRLPVIRIPSAMFYPPPQEIISSGDQICLCRWSLLKQMFNFSPDIRSNPFICIQTEYPVIGSMGESLIPEFAKSLEGIVKHIRGKFMADFSCPVGTMRIDDDEFIDPG